MTQERFVSADFPVVSDLHDTAISARLRRKNPRRLERLYGKRDAEDKDKSRRSQRQPPGREPAINFET